MTGAYIKTNPKNLIDPEQAIDEEFGHWLKTQRKKRGFNVTQAALEAKIGRIRLHELEAGKGRGITLNELRRLRMVYQCDETEMFARAEGKLI
jgi:DNA-binding Xre family transcriptional regulator